MTEVTKRKKEREERGQTELKVFLMPARACIKEDILKGWNNENVKDKPIWSKDEMFSNFKKIASLLTIAFFAMLLLPACGGAQGKARIDLHIVRACSHQHPASLPGRRVLSFLYQIVFVNWLY